MILSAPEVIVSPTSLTVTENQTATFYCSAYGNPEPSVSWSKTNGTGQGNKKGEGKKLQIKSAGYNDSGSYVCTATTVLGQAKKLVKLFVEGKCLLCMLGRYAKNRLCKFDAQSHRHTFLSVLIACMQAREGSIESLEHLHVNTAMWYYFQCDMCHSRHFSLSKMNHVHTAVHLQTVNLRSFVNLSLIIFNLHLICYRIISVTIYIFFFILKFSYNARSDWLK